MCFKKEDESAGRTLETAVERLLGAEGDPRTKIDKLYSYLDILDRKASSICTVNSLLLAVNGLLIFRPPPSVDTATDAGLCFWKMLLLPCGLVAIVVSLVTVIYALRVNSMKWAFLHKFNPAAAGDTAFVAEIQGLCVVISSRTRHVRWQGWLTIASIAATLGALFLICLHTY